MENHFAVTVHCNFERILNIESNSLSGKANLSDAELECIRDAGKHLLAFAGNGKNEFLPDAESVGEVSNQLPEMPKGENVESV